MEVLEEAEARQREASGHDVRKQEAAAEKARKAVKASRDKQAGRKATEDALYEGTAGLRLHKKLTTKPISPKFRLLVHYVWDLE